MKNIRPIKELEKSLSKCIRTENDNKKNLSDKIDDIVLNPILAYPIFIGLLYTLFKFTFDWVGRTITRIFSRSNRNVHTRTCK
ncbi:hypothetical protein Q5M85_15975 [Paraclostridium bifermentans]|nr:hypothetical protein [Paraclostridium bifermentans]